MALQGAYDQFYFRVEETDDFQDICVQNYSPGK